MVLPSPILFIPYLILPSPFILHVLTVLAWLPYWSAHHGLSSSSSLSSSLPPLSSSSRPSPLAGASLPAPPAFLSSATTFCSARHSGRSSPSSTASGRSTAPSLAAPSSSPDHAYAHRTLVAAGATFADGPPSPVPRYTGFASARYCPEWRLLRRNLMSKVLHPARVKSHADDRAWALGLFLGKLAAESEASGCVRVGESFHYTMFSLLMLMCFGERMEEWQVREVERTQREVLLRVVQFNQFTFLPRFTKFLYRKRWNEIQAIRRRQMEVFLPPIRARMKKQRKEKDGCSYVDSLLRLEIPEEGGRRLTEKEVVILCSEFQSSGTETTCTTFEWAMANLVKHPDIQRKLAEEIESVMEEKRDGHNSEYIGGEDLQKMKYLRAVVMETLRIHSPTYFGEPHAVKEELEIDGYVIPKNATVNFAVAEMGRDGKVWKQPMEFRPERFMEEEVDITGTKDIKMMPFGAGRRICPGMDLAMLHLDWFVANLVWKYEWKAKDGEDVDLAENADEFTVCMKKSLAAVGRRSRRPCRYDLIDPIIVLRVSKNNNK